MSSLNKVMLMGNLTRDPETRYTGNGTAVTDLGLAINRTYTKDGQRQEETTFVDVTVWGRQGETAGQYLSKGRPVLIEGRLQLDTWQDKQSGQNRSKLKVVGDHVTFLPGAGEGRRQDDGAAARAAGQDVTAPQTTHQLAADHPAGQDFHRGGSHPASQAPATTGQDMADQDIPF